MTRFLRAAMTCVFVLGLAGCSESGAPSPRAAFDRRVQAGESGDWKTVFRLTDPGQADRVLAMSTMAAHFSIRGQDTRDQLNAIEQRYGVDKFATSPKKALEKVSDKAGYFEALMEFMVEQAGEVPDKISLKGATLSGLKETGETATATMTLGKKESKVKFVKRDGAWYLAMGK